MEYRRRKGLPLTPFKKDQDSLHKEKEYNVLAMLLREAVSLLGNYQKEGDSAILKFRVNTFLNRFSQKK